MKRKEYKFPEILIKLMDRKKLTQRALAKDSGIAYSTINKWVIFRAIPSGDSLMRLSEYFDVSIDYLIYGEER